MHVPAVPEPLIRALAQVRVIPTGRAEFGANPEGCWFLLGDAYAEQVEAPNCVFSLRHTARLRRVGKNTYVHMYDRSIVFHSDGGEISAQDHARIVRAVGGTVKLYGHARLDSARGCKVHARDHAHVGYAGPQTEVSVFDEGVRIRTLGPRSRLIVLTRGCASVDTARPGVGLELDRDTRAVFENLPDDIVLLCRDGIADIQHSGAHWQITAKTKTLAEVVRRNMP